MTNSEESNPKYACGVGEASPCSVKLQLLRPYYFLKSHIFRLLFLLLWNLSSLFKQSYLIFFGKVLIKCTSVHYKPTDSHSYLLHSSSHPSHVKNSIPYSQFLRLRRLCSDDSDFSNKSKEMCQFFEKRGYPASVIQAAQHYKRHKRKRMAEFHSPSHFTLAITQ